MSQRQDDEVSVIFLVFILVFVVFFLSGCNDYVDKNAKSCNYEYGTKIDCSADDCACYEKCALAAAMSETPHYNTRVCIESICVQRGYVRVCR